MVTEPFARWRLLTDGERAAIAAQNVLDHFYDEPAVENAARDWEIDPDAIRAAISKLDAVRAALGRLQEGTR